MKLSYTLWLIFINIGVFFIQLLFHSVDFIEYSTGGIIEDIFALNPRTFFTRGYVWQIFTYMFLHAGPVHLFYNMFGLLVFGPKIELVMGRKKFLEYYLICGVGSALFHMLLSGINNIPMLGASGAIFGVLTAYGLMFPRDIIYVQFFFPMPAIVFVIFYGLFQFVLGIASLGKLGGGVAYLGHVGGMITGFILLKLFGFSRKRVIYFWE